MDRALDDLPGITIRRAAGSHPRTTDAHLRSAARRAGRALRAAGIDIETLHVDVCSDLELFGGRLSSRLAPGAESRRAMQLPLLHVDRRQAARVACVVGCAAPRAMNLVVCIWSSGHFDQLFDRQLTNDDKMTK
jgi:hypothetical protein